MKRSVREEKGQVLVFVALALFVILALAALGIDVGYMYSVRHELQRSADTGALAGASRFIEPGSEWSADPSDPVMVEADDRAREFAAKDPVVASPLDRMAEVDVAFPSLYRIRVTTRRTVPMFFARILGRDNQAISATAVAEAAVADANVQCLKPWGIPLPWNDNGTTPGNDRYEPGLGEQLMQISDIPEGYRMILKVGEPYNKNGQLDIPTLQQESGHFFALAMCGNTGASYYRERIENPCLDTCGVDNNGYVAVEPGNMVGPTKQGVDGLIALDPSAQWATPNGEPLPANDNLWVTGSDYANWRDSPRVVKIPLYDPNDLLNSGRTEIKVVGFAAFWLEGYDPGHGTQGTVTGYFVSGDVKGASTSGPAPGLALRVLRLVE